MKPDSYDATAKALHWSMAVIWIAAWVIGAVAGFVRDSGSTDRTFTAVHKSVASILILMVVVRVAWRLTHRPPPLPDSMSPVLKRAAGIGHYALYILALLVLPLSGWLWTSVAGHTVSLLGLVTLPNLTPPLKDYYPLARQVHVTVAWATGALVLGHIAIAIKHHVVDRDGVLLGMLPRYGASSRTGGR